MSTFFSRLFGPPGKLLCLPFKSFLLPQVASPPTVPCAMNVTSASFPFEAVNIIQHIAKSRFIAFDFEFSGVAGRNPGGGSGKLGLQDYYEELRSAAQIYQILQVGLTIVTEEADKGRYVARPYNFNLSPLPALKESTFRRDWSYNSGGKNGSGFL
jgi:poly(A)-specific ribonuclease